MGSAVNCMVTFRKDVVGRGGIEETEGHSPGAEMQPGRSWSSAGTPPFFPSGSGLQAEPVECLGGTDGPGSSTKLGLESLGAKMWKITELPGCGGSAISDPGKQENGFRPASDSMSQPAGVTTSILSWLWQSSRTLGNGCTEAKRN